MEESDIDLAVTIGSDDPGTVLGMWAAQRFILASTMIQIAISSGVHAKSAAWCSSIRANAADTLR